MTSVAAGDERLERARARSAAERPPVTAERIAKLCRSGSADDRLLALVLVQKQMQLDGPREEHLRVARRLVGDASDSCRWQALFVIGRFVGKTPEAVWEIVTELGSGKDAKMRSAVATALLEPLLDHHYDKYFRRLEARIRRGDPNLTDTLQKCWMFGGAKRHSREVDKLLRSVVGARRT